MATTFSTAWKNKFIDYLTGKAAYVANDVVPGYINIYSGTMPATPETSAPVGAGLSSATGYSVHGNWLVAGSHMSAASAGVSSLSAPRTLSNGSYATGGTAAWCRLFNQLGTAIMDTSVSLVGGGGGLILNTLALPTTTTNATINAYSMKIPPENGSVKYNVALTNELAECCSGANSPTQVGMFITSTIYFYDGTAPATADAAITGSLLGSMTISTHIYNLASSGSAALTSGTNTITVTGTGTVTHARIVKGALTMQVSVGSSGADFIVDQDNWTSGVNRNLSSATLQY